MTFLSLQSFGSTLHIVQGQTATPMAQAWPCTSGCGQKTTFGYCGFVLQMCTVDDSIALQNVWTYMQPHFWTAAAPNNADGHPRHMNCTILTLWIAQLQVLDGRSEAEPGTARVSATRSPGLTCQGAIRILGPLSNARARCEASTAQKCLESALRIHVTMATTSE